MIRPRDSFELELANIWETVTGIRPVGVTDSFFDLGGDSLAAEWMLLEVEKRFRRKVPPRVLYEANTIEKMAVLLRLEGWQPRTAVVNIQPYGSRPPLFCIPPPASIWAYRGMSHYLGPDQPMFVLQPTPEGNHNPFGTIEEEAAFYVSQMQALQPVGEYYLNGWSYGGIVAFEVAQLLAVHGQRTAFLGILDTGFVLTDFPSRLTYLRNQMRYGLQPGPFARLRQVSRQIQMRPSAGMLPRSNRRWENLPSSSPRRELHANYRRLRQYKPQAYDGRVTFFRTHQRAYVRLLRDPLWGWGKIARGGVDVQDVPGNHHTMMVEPNVGELARKFRRCLRAAQEEAVRA